MGKSVSSRRQGGNVRTSQEALVPRWRGSPLTPGPGDLQPLGVLRGSSAWRWPIDSHWGSYFGRSCSPSKGDGHITQAMYQAAGVMFLVLFRGVIKVRHWGGFPLTHHLGDDFDIGKIMGPVILLHEMCLQDTRPESVEESAPFGPWMC